MLQKQRKDHIRIECWVTSNTVEGLLIRIVKCSLDLATRKWVYSKGLIEKTKRVFWSRVQGPKDGNYVECCERGQCRSFQTQRSVSHFPTSSCCGVPCLTPGHHCLCSLCEMKIPVTSCCLPLAGLKNFFFYFFIIFGCAEPSLWCAEFLLQRLPCCRAQALDAQASVVIDTFAQ